LIIPNRLGKVRKKSIGKTKNEKIYVEYSISNPDSMSLFFKLRKVYLLKWPASVSSLLHKKLYAGAVIINTPPAEYS
jgi:hypothetical protein